MGVRRGLVAGQHRVGMCYSVDGAEEGFGRLRFMCACARAREPSPFNPYVWASFLTCTAGAFWVPCWANKHARAGQRSTKHTGFSRGHLCPLFMFESHLERNTPTKELVDDAATVFEVVRQLHSVENLKSKTPKSNYGVFLTKALFYTKT